MWQHCPALDANLDLLREMKSRADRLFEGYRDMKIRLKQYYSAEIASEEEPVPKTTQVTACTCGSQA
jgi:hypothetical protein